jgi:hypothetical protein
MFDTAFFGYSDLPDMIDLNGKELVPLKSIRLKYHGTSQQTPFDVSNLRHLCNVLGIELHRPVKGLYCIEKCYSQFFDFLYSFYVKEVTSIGFYGPYYYDQNGNLMWLDSKKCSGQMIQNLFQSFFNS